MLPSTKQEKEDAKKETSGEHKKLAFLFSIVPPLEAPPQPSCHSIHQSLTETILSQWNTLRRMELLGWIAHMICLNQLADHPLIQSLILSLYVCGRLYADPYSLYKFFEMNFTILPLAYENVWCTRLNESVVSKRSHGLPLWRRAMLRRLVRVIRRREGPAPMVHLLCVALCRCLGVPSRLVMSLPPSCLKNVVKAEELNLVFEKKKPESPLTVVEVQNSLKTIMVHTPPEGMIDHWLTLLNIKKKYSRYWVAETQHYFTTPDCTPNLWVEVFSKHHRRWIPFNIKTLHFDQRDQRTYALQRESHLQRTQDFHNCREFVQTKTVTLENSVATVPVEKKRTKTSLTQHLLLSSSSCSEENVASGVVLTLKDETLRHESDAFPREDWEKSKETDSFMDCMLDHESIPLSPLNREDRILHQMSYAFSFSQPVVKREKKRPFSSCDGLLDCLMVCKNQGSQNVDEEDMQEEEKSKSLIILACNAFHVLRDVTLRYRFQEWSSVLEKRGKFYSTVVGDLVDEWNSWIASRQEKETDDYMIVKAFDGLDAGALQRKASEEMFPKSKGLFRYHSRFVLESQLPFNKTIYPREPVFGYFKGEPVFARQNVHQLFTKRQWMEFKNRVVLEQEQPWKTRRVRGPKESGSVSRVEQLVELFGLWQTKPFNKSVMCETLDEKKTTRPIPCSKYGSVNLIGKRCVPTGCVHLRGMPGLVYIVRELNVIPWRPALIDFERQNGLLKPVYDGLVIWETDQDLVLQQYKEYRERRLSFRYVQHCEKIQKLWTQLLKCLMGRYYMAMNERNRCGAMQGSFRSALALLTKHYQDHVEGTETDEKTCGMEEGDVD